MSMYNSGGSAEWFTKGNRSVVATGFEVNSHPLVFVLDFRGKHLSQPAFIIDCGLEDTYYTLLNLVENGIVHLQPAFRAYASSFSDFPDQGSHFEAADPSWWSEVLEVCQDILTARQHDIEMRYNEF